MVIDEGPVGTAVVGDGEAFVLLVINDGSMRLAHLELWDFDALCPRRLPVCVCVCVCVW